MASKKIKSEEVVWFEVDPETKQFVRVWGMRAGESEFEVLIDHDNKHLVLPSVYPIDGLRSEVPVVYGAFAYPNRDGLFELHPLPPTNKFEEHMAHPKFLPLTERERADLVDNHPLVVAARERYLRTQQIALDTWQQIRTAIAQDAEFRDQFEPFEYSSPNEGDRESFNFPVARDIPDSRGTKKRKKLSLKERKTKKKTDERVQKLFRNL